MGRVNIETRLIERLTLKIKYFQKLQWHWQEEKREKGTDGEGGQATHEEGGRPGSSIRIHIDDQGTKGKEIAGDRGPL